MVVIEEDSDRGSGLQIPIHSRKFNRRNLPLPQKPQPRSQSPSAGYLMAQSRVNQKAKANKVDPTQSKFYKRFRSVKEAAEQIRFNRLHHNQNLKGDKINTSPDCMSPKGGEFTTRDEKLNFDDE